MATHSDHSILDLEHFLPYRLSVLSNRISQTIAALYQERFALNITEWRIIAILGRYPDISANELGVRTAMDKVSISRGVSKLLERGLVEREFHDQDKRRSVLQLSQDGLDIYNQVAPLALSLEEKFLNSLSKSEQQQLNDLISKLLANVHI